MEYYRAERKKESLPFMTAWMELENIILSEISQLVNSPVHFIYKMNIMTKQTNEQNGTRDMKT